LKVLRALPAVSAKRLRVLGPPAGRPQARRRVHAQVRRVHSTARPGQASREPSIRQQRQAHPAQADGELGAIDEVVLVEVERLEELRMNPRRLTLHVHGCMAARTRSRTLDAHAHADADADTRTLTHAYALPPRNTRARAHARSRTRTRSHAGLHQSQTRADARKPTRARAFHRTEMRKGAHANQP
jgi:hypothetical protein